MTDSHELSIFADQGLSDDQSRFLGVLLRARTLTLARKMTGVTEYQCAKWRVEQPAFDTALQRTRAMVIDGLVDGLLDTETANVPADPQMAKLRADNIKWLAGKLMPKMYGDRIDVNVSTTVDISGALAEARSRALRLRCDSDQPIDVEFEAVPNVAASQPPDNESSAPPKTPELPDIFS